MIAEFGMESVAILLKLQCAIYSIGYFEQSLYENEGILTSRDIQTQFFGAIARRKKSKSLKY